MTETMTMEPVTTTADQLREVGDRLAAKRARGEDVARQLGALIDDIEEAHQTLGRAVADGQATDAIRKRIGRLDAEAEGLRLALPMIEADILVIEAEHRAMALKDAEALRRRTRDAAMEQVEALDAMARAWLDGEFLGAFDVANKALRDAARAEAHHASLTGQRLLSVSEAIDVIGARLPGAFNRIEALRHLCPAPQLPAGEPIVYRPALTRSIEEMENE